jgi:hypothetical protein
MYRASYFCTTAAKLEMESTCFSKNPKCKIQQKYFKWEPVLQCGGTEMTTPKEAFRNCFANACDDKDDNDNDDDGDDDNDNNDDYNNYNNNNLTYTCK